MSLIDTERRALGLAGLAALIAPGWAAAQAPTIHAEIWKSLSCGCCKDWIAHMQASGFRFRVHEVGNTAIRERLKIPMELGSCHTALIGRYAIEGHVPAADVLRLLK
jgi:hypothetical protein